jgi:uncharacterized protein (TIGR02266 family)
MDAIQLVVPVRFSGGGLSMQTTTSKVGLESVFIRCMVAPKSGAAIKIELTLPAAEGPVELTGTVSERVGPGDRTKEAGFWAKLDPLNEYANKSLSAALGIRAPATPKAPPRVQRPEAPKTREASRAFERIKARLQVGWATAREFLVAYSENISRGGIFVATQNPPDLREVVELLLELPDGGGPAKTDAEVVHRVTAEQATRGRVAGAGLQFVGADDEFRERLDRCMENLLAEEGA